MCRSIKTLRAPYTERVTDEDMRAAALQYVRKVSGFRAPAAHNAAAFDQAVRAITEAARARLTTLEVRSMPRGGDPPNPPQRPAVVHRRHTGHSPGTRPGSLDRLDRPAVPRVQPPPTEPVAHPSLRPGFAAGRQRRHRDRPACRRRP